MINKVKELLGRVEARILSHRVNYRVEYDNEFQTSSGDARIFIQCTYYALCSKTGYTKEWHGRKWYLSKHMTEDEIIKTSFAAFKATIEHEIMEGFKVDGKILFNPHVSYESLLSITDNEVIRKEKD